MSKSGVDLESVGAYVNMVKENEGFANVTFRAKSAWKKGTRADVSISQFFANGEPASRPDRNFTVQTDEPPQLGGADTFANPEELLAASLCGCLTAGIATNAALFETDLQDLNVQVELNWDMKGVLGLDRSVPNGPLNIHYIVEMKGDSEEKLKKAKEVIDKKSPVLNSLLNQMKITSEFKLIK